MLRADVLPEPQSQTAVIATYLQSLSNMIDVAEKRLAAFESRVPTTVWLIIFIVGGLSKALLPDIV